MLDFINIVYVLTLLLIVKKYYKITDFDLLILLVHLFSVFMFNDFLFKANYMPDQFSYLDVAKHLRSFEFEKIQQYTTVLYSSIIFAIFPIPFIESLYSLGIINFLLYLIIFIFTFKKNIFNNKLAYYFYFLFPSLLMYHSLALRDMLVFTIMYFIVYCITFKKNYILLGILLFFLSLVKIQNFLIISVVLFIIVLFSSSYNNKSKIFIFLLFGIIYFYYNSYFSLEHLNFYRWSIYSENYSNTNTYIPISSIQGLFSRIIPDTLYFMFRPVPWIENNIFHIIQFIENIIIIYCIIYIIFKELKYKLLTDSRIIFLNLFLLISMILYGLVIFNSGTAVRYKFPIVTIYVIYSLYFINSYKKKVVKECAE